MIDAATQAAQASIEQARAAWAGTIIGGLSVVTGAAVAWIAVTGSTRDRLMDRLTQDLRDLQLKAAAARTGRRALVSVLLARRFARKTVTAAQVDAEAFSRAGGHKRRMAFRRQAVQHFLGQEMTDPILVSWLLESMSLMEEAQHCFVLHHDDEGLKTAMSAFLGGTADLEKRRKSIRDSLEREETAAEDEVEALEDRLRSLQTWGWLWPYRYIAPRRSAPAPARETEEADGA